MRCSCFLLSRNEALRKRLVAQILKGWVFMENCDSHLKQSHESYAKTTFVASYFLSVKRSICTRKKQDTYHHVKASRTRFGSNTSIHTGDESGRKKTALETKRKATRDETGARKYEVFLFIVNMSICYLYIVSEVHTMDF